MKKIKILSAIMALAMMMTTFASCGQVDEEPIDGDATVATTTLGNVTTTVETDEVVLTTTSGSSTTTSNTTTTSKTSTTTKKSSTTTTTTSKSSSATTTTRENNNNWTTTNYSPDPEPQPQPTYTEAPRPTPTTTTKKPETRPTTTTKKPAPKPTTTTTQAPEPAKVYPRCDEEASVETYDNCIIKDLNNTGARITDYKVTVISGNPEFYPDNAGNLFRIYSFTAGEIKVELTWNFPENGINNYKTTTKISFYE